MKQPQDKSTVDLEDIFVWPDNDIYYYRYEVTEEIIRFKGYDYLILYWNTPEYWRVVGEPD